MERTLYNGLISGVSLDGKAFFYPNPLESTASTNAARGSGAPAVRANITRFLASVPGYVYAQRGDTLFVNLFVGEHGRNRDGRWADGQDHAGDAIPVGRRGEDDGRSRTDPGRFAVQVRIPGLGARRAASPGGLYRFADESKEPPKSRSTA